LRLGANDKAAPRYAVTVISDSSARYRLAVAIIAPFVPTLADCAAVTAFAASKHTRPPRLSLSIGTEASAPEKAKLSFFTGNPVGQYFAFLTVFAMARRPCRK
jgi:hypothetical protein